METLIFGTGGMGRAIEAAILERGRERGWPPPRLVGRPAGGRHDPAVLPAVDVVFEASRGPAVAGNIAAALAAGNRRFVIATTAWEADRPLVTSLLVEHGAAAVAAPNFSLGVALFARLVEEATRLFGQLPAYDPFVLEWHRRTKVDRPSGTAKELARRILAAHPRKTRLAEAGRDGAPEPDELEVAVVRAGASPGMHLVGFDAPGETIELRLTARDRSAYAAGALAAAEWLLAEPRQPGLHGFDPVVEALVASAARVPEEVPA
ncbi:MAG TPA: dihydrodipicolinate reductase C-terminal domain-containing protein [Candidatus Binatia bacterium]|nr:dihydrodipicolinate reductase C-terminal domain-containing protein [Candidatus Binatia bacterium]